MLLESRGKSQARNRPELMAARSPGTAHESTGTDRHGGQWFRPQLGRRQPAREGKLQRKPLRKRRDELT